MNAQRGSGYMSTLSLTSALDWVDGQPHAPAASPQGKRTGNHFVGGCVAPGPVWTGAENFAPTGIGSPDRPARSESLYRLRCSSPQKIVVGL
jgi:hypothetical protein